MTCTPANEPQLIAVTDLIYSPADYERRFLTGWWTRGVVPADNFTSTNWAGLIIPQKITFDNNEITIDYPGRWWGDLNCPNSTPKVQLRIQYLCKGGRVYLHTSVRYGKTQQQQLYAGHNGAAKYSRVVLEKIDEQCSLEKTADIPLEKADILELKHLADWIATMASAPGVTQSGEPNSDWLFLLADYTEIDFAWSPCDGCIFPKQNYSVPEVLSEDNMLQLELRLAAQDIKALGDIIFLSSIPDAFNVPLCLHNTYLEVSIPELMGVMHMRTFFSCNSYFEDMYTTIPVSAGDIANCFQFPEPEPIWPAKDNPKWKDECPANETISCNLSITYESAMTGYTGPPTGGSSFGTNSQAPLCSGQGFIIPSKRPQPQEETVTIVATSSTVKFWNAMVCTVQGGYGPPTQVMSCVRFGTSETRVVGTRKASTKDNQANIIISQMYAANTGWNCSSIFNDTGDPGPPQPNVPKDDNPQGPNGDGDCFLEGELVYQLRLTTALGDLGYTLSVPVRAKVPQGTANLGPITGSLSGTNLSISTQLGGNFNADLGGLASGFNAIGNTISNILPVSFGLRNVRTLCP